MIPELIHNEREQSEKPLTFQRAVVRPQSFKPVRQHQNAAFFPHARQATSMSWAPYNGPRMSTDQSVLALGRSSFGALSSWND